MIRKFYRFPSPYDVAYFLYGVSQFTNCEHSTAWNDCRVAYVETERESDIRFADSMAREAHGKEIPPAEAEGKAMK